MKKKWRKILMAFLCFATICTCGASFARVYAKYVSLRGPSGAIGGDSGDLPYEVENAFVVETQEALFNAIQYGYSHIQLSPDIKDPFIITQDVTDLNKSMLLDVNGVEIQRNSRQPMLQIPNGVTLTIVDTSAEQTGGLYNPVGSVLDVDGGTLMVKGGKFETGPRYYEYYRYKIDESIPVTGTRLIAGQNADGTDNGKSYPNLIPIITTENDRQKADGNVYFDEAYGAIPADTYCYYVSSDGMTSGDTVQFNRGSASFTYTYYVEASTHEFISANQPTSGTLNVDYVQVMVYGYENVFKTAVGDGEDYPHYAAIKMLAGELTIAAQKANDEDYHGITDPKDMKSGCFVNHFGLAQTACIYLAGGKMTVERAGAFVSANPENFAGLGISAEDASPAESLNASTGRGACITTSADNTGTLIIKSGVYRSYNLNCVQMSSGTIEINGGYFQKRSTVQTPEVGRSAVYVASGICNVSNAEFLISSSATHYLDDEDADTLQEGYWGSNVYALYATGGTLNVDDCQFTIKGDYATGLYSSSSSSSSSTLRNVVVTMRGNHVYGLYSHGGRVEMTGDAQGTLASEMSMQMTLGEDLQSGATGNYSYGVYANGGVISFDKVGMEIKGGNSYGIYSARAETETPASVNTEEITSKNSAYHLDGDASHCVYAESGTIAFEGGRMHVLGDDCLGIVLQLPNGEASTAGNITSANVEFEFTGARSGAIKLNGGDLAIEGGSVTMTGENAVALYSLGGDVLSRGVTYTMTEGKSFGVYATAGNITLHDSTVDLYSRNECYGIMGISTEDDNSLKIDAFNTDILVGGTYSDDTVTWSTDAREMVDGKYPASMGLFLANLTSSECYVSLYQCTISSIDIGVGVRGGKVFLQNGTSEKENLVRAKNASAFAVAGGTVYVGNVKAEYLDTLVGGIGGRSEIKLAELKAAESEGKEVVESSDKELSVSCNLGTGEQLAYTTPNPTLADKKKVTAYPNSDGMYIFGGSLLSVDAINMDFTGIENYDDSDVSTVSGETIDAYTDCVTKSYAIRADNANAGGVATFLMRKGTIVNHVGGGVFVSKAKVTLGEEGASDDTVSIQANGDNTADIIRGLNKYSDDLTLMGGAEWTTDCFREGGDAVAVEDGELIIYCGTYSANQGNGISIDGTVDTSNATIKSGIFRGGQAGVNTYRTGPAACSALKVWGGAMIVEDGDFGVESTATAVTVMGREDRNSCLVELRRGTYRGSRTLVFLGNSTIKMGEDVTQTGTDPLQVTGSAYALGVEPIKRTNDNRLHNDFKLDIYSGTYVGTGGSSYSCLYIGNEHAVVNTLTSPTTRNNFTVHRGTFITAMRMLSQWDTTWIDSKSVTLSDVVPVGSVLDVNGTTQTVTESTAFSAFFSQDTSGEKTVTVTAP